MGFGIKSNFLLALENTSATSKASNTVESDDGYVVADGYVYYHQYVFGADPRTFETVYDKNNGGPIFAKDDNKCYYNDQSIDGCDSSSFSLLLGADGEFTGYATDKNFVYVFYDDTSGNLQHTALSGLSPSDFHLVSNSDGKFGGYAIDNGDVFYISFAGSEVPTVSILPRADSKNFKLLTSVETTQSPDGCDAISGSWCFVGTSSTPL